MLNVFDSRSKVCLRCRERDGMAMHLHSNCYTCKKEICIECPANRKPVCTVDKKCRFGHSFSMSEAGRGYTDHVYCDKCVVEEERCHVLCDIVHDDITITKRHCANRCREMQTSLRWRGRRAEPPNVTDTSTEVALAPIVADTSTKRSLAQLLARGFKKAQMREGSNERRLK